MATAGDVTSWFCWGNKLEEQVSPVKQGAAPVPLSCTELTFIPHIHTDYQSCYDKGTNNTFSLSVAVVLLLMVKLVH